MDDVKQKILDILATVKREGIQDLIKYLDTKTDYFTAPASANYHSNIKCGLSIHSLFTRDLFKLKNEQFHLGLLEDTINICGLGHDICKCDFYKRGFKNVKKGTKPNGYANWVEKEVWEIDDLLPLSHGHKSVILLQRFIPLSEFEVLAIAWHMGLPEDYESRQSYNKAVSKYPAIVALHTADIESSHLMEEVSKE